MSESEEIVVEKEPEGKDVTVEDVTDALLGEDKHAEKKADGPPPGHPRWNEIYGKSKELERKTEQLEKEREADRELMAEMRKHHDELRSAIERSAQATEKMSEATVKSLEKKEEDSFASELAGIHTRLVAQKKEAYESGDHERVAEIDDKIMDVKLEMREHKNKKGIASKQDAPKATGVTPDPKEVEKFKAATDWFNKDVFMTGAAVEMERKLLSDPAWQSRSYGDVLAEVKEKVEERFGMGEEKKKGKTPAVNAVEGGGNVSGKGGPTTVHLTAQDLKMAKEFGITPEQWAKEKSFISKRGA
jgi:hypothetical protein